MRIGVKSHLASSVTRQEHDADAIVDRIAAGQLQCRTPGVQRASTRALRQQVGVEASGAQGARLACSRLPPEVATAVSPPLLPGPRRDCCWRFGRTLLSRDCASLKALGDMFIAAIKMLIGPIIFYTVVHGIAGIQDMKKVGRVGLKALLHFEVMTTLALTIGLLVANL